MPSIRDDEDLDPRPEPAQEPSPVVWALTGGALVLLYILALCLLTPST